MDFLWYVETSWGRYGLNVDGVRIESLGSGLDCNVGRPRDDDREPVSDGAEARDMALRANGYMDYLLGVTVDTTSSLQ
jgi:hypothetical protein